MTTPTSYTAANFALYLEDVLGTELLSALNINIAFDSEIIMDTLFDYGVSDVEDATEIQKLRKLGVYNLWKYAMGIVSGRVKQSADGLSLDAQQYQEHIEKMLKLATSAVKPYLSSRKAVVGILTTIPNPYEYSEVRIDPNDINLW